MNERVYHINFSKLIRWLTPQPLRDVFMLTWLGVLITPIARLHQDFLRFRKAKLYFLGITPQVCYLEKMLNDSFDFTQRRIRINDAIWYPPTYLYQEAELKALYLYQEVEDKPLILYTEGEAGVYQDDFVVLVPFGLIYNVEEMKANIDTFKLASTKYTIQSN